jgi:glutamate transport system permease protein
MTTPTRLFDEPGPKARRRIRIGSVIAALSIAALLVVAALRLNQYQEFSPAKWGPLIDPNDPSFYPLWRVLVLGLERTLLASVLAVALSLPLGFLLAVGYMRVRRTARLPLIAGVELIRGIPLVITIYFVASVLPQLGITLAFAPGGSYLWYLVIGLTIYNTVVIGEIIRAGIAALPAGQEEAAKSIGLSRTQVMRTVLLPQAVRIILPVLIQQLIIIVKDTSLAAVVLGQYQELLRSGNLAIQQLYDPVQIYLAVAAIYVAINLTLSSVVGFVERRLSQTRGSAPQLMVGGTTFAGPPSA